MEYERRARSDLVRYLWTVIGRQTPPIATEYTIVKTLMDEGAVATKGEAEALINDALEDGFLDMVKRTPAKYKIPADDGFSIANIPHDLYCFECHKPNNLSNCESCSRVFHEQCHRSALTTTLPERRNIDDPEILPLTQPSDESLIFKLKHIRESFGDQGEREPHISRRKEDVICIGQVRAPRRKRLPSFNHKISADDGISTENEQYVMLCPSCRLKRSFEHQDPPLDSQELNHLLNFLFTQKKTWILAKTYPPLATSMSMPPNLFHLFEKKFLKFPTRRIHISNKLKFGEYQKATELICDIMDIKHSMGILYGTHSPEYEACTLLNNDCNRELSELRNCSDCYRHSNEKCNELWFCKPCFPRHELVFAKQIGFSYWPAKVIKLEEKVYDVRFFGNGHKRAKIASNRVLPIDTDIDTLKIKKTPAFKDAMNELRIHQELIELPPGSFSFYNERESPFDTSKTSYFMQLEINKKLDRNKRKKNGHGSRSQEQISQLSFNVTTSSISPCSEHRSQTLTPFSRLRKRRMTTDGNTIQTTHSTLVKPRRISISLRSSTRQQAQVSGENDQISRAIVNVATPKVAHGFRRQDQVSTRKSIIGNSKFISNEHMNPQVILTPIRTSSRQKMQCDDNDGHSSSVFELEMPTKSVQQPTPHTRTRAKSRDDIVEKLRQQLIDKKCPPAACKIATKALQNEINRRTELEKTMKKLVGQHYEAIAANKRVQWCCVCQKEADRNCCWNTSYCSMECGNRHWQEGHREVCSRNANR